MAIEVNNMPRSSTSFKPGWKPPADRKTRKGSPNIEKVIQKVYQLRFKKEIQKELEDGTFKSVKLSAIEFLIGADLEIINSDAVAPQVKAKIIADLLPYLFKKESEKIEVDMNANVDCSTLSREELYKMVFENNEENKENENDGTTDTETE